MNQVTLTTVDGLDPRDMLAIRTRLTKPGSEFQLEVASVMEGEGSSSTPLAVWHHDGAMLGWACSHVWRQMQTLEQFVDERHRRAGIGTALASMLVGAGVVNAAKVVAVFSPTTADIARRLGVSEVVLFQRNGSDWSEV